MEKRSLENQESTSYFIILGFWRCALHRFNGKFTLNVWDAQVFKTKSSEIGKLLIYDKNLRISFALNRQVPGISSLYCYQILGFRDLLVS